MERKNLMEASLLSNHKEEDDSFHEKWTMSLNPDDILYEHLPVGL